MKTMIFLLYRAELISFQIFLGGYAFSSRSVRLLAIGEITLQRYIESICGPISSDSKFKYNRYM